MEDDSSKIKQKYNKDIPVQTEFLRQPSKTDKVVVINESICLYD